MKNKNTRILLIEDNPGDTRLVREALAEAGAACFDLVAKMDLAGGLAALDAQPVDAVLLDLTLPDSSGFETFSKMHEKAPQLPIIVLTGADDDVLAAKALREGAQDYLVKGRGNSELLLRSIRYAIQRKQSEELMRENEARYRNIFEGVEDAIFVETLTGQILDVNQRACDMYGYTREQFLTKTVADLVPSGEYSILFDPRDPAKHSDHPIETINVRSNGEQFPIELSLRKQESKTEPVLFVVCRDSTERKQAEQAIHLMSDAQRQIAQLNDITEISRLVGKKIHELIGDGYVIISMLDEQIQAMKVVELFGFGSLYEKLVHQFKIDPSKISYPIQDMTAKELHSFRSGKLEKFAGGVYELLTRKVPKKICGLVEKQMKFSGIHTMGFVNQDIHYGALTILEKGDIGPYKEMIETIMNQATISIKRIRAEQALRASEMRYRAVARMSSDFSYSCVHTREDRYEVDWISDAFFHITGYSEAEIHEQRCWMFIVHPQDQQAATEPMLRLQPGESDSREFRIITKSGSVRWFANTMECQSDPSTSGGLRLFGAVQDITARKHAEEARQESELLLRALFELSPDSILLMDPHTPDDSWPIIECNEAACRINGFERYELIGNSIDMLNAFPANSVDRAAYRKRMREEDGLHLEAFHRHKDGTVFPVEISTRLIQVGTRELVIGIDRDITGRKQVETALQESEQRFREIFENMSSGVFVYSSENSGQVFRIADCNRAAEKIEKIARETLIGKNLCEAFPGVEEFGFIEALKRVWGTGKPEHIPTSFYKDERISGWRENYLARLPSGEVIAVYDDVTERKLAEESLRASEELFRSFIEQSSEGVILLDEQGCILEWNRAQAQITGFSPQEAIGEPFWNIQYQMLPSERRTGRSPEFFKQAMLSAFQTGKFPTTDKAIETKILTPQGETKFILQASFPIHSGGGYRVGSLVRDITERKRAELELQASHAAEKEFSERLFTLSEVTTELSKAGGLDETCRRVVELGKERLGFDRISIWFISDDHTSMQGTFGVGVAGQITDERHERFLIGPDFPVWNLVAGQVPLVHIPGESLYLDGQVIGQGDHVFAGLWEGNTVTGYISVDNLLSQRPFSEHDCEIIRLYASAVGGLISLKRAKTALRLSEENYRGAIAAAGLVPYGIDYETQSFTFMGDNILHLTGYSAEEITPAILKDCVQESHVWGLEATGITQEEAPRRFRSGAIKQWGNDLRITTRSGEERWLSDVSVPLSDKQGKITSAIGIFQDLTERKQAEQALQKSEAHFRSIFENTAIGFYQTTPSGQILLANPAILHMLGYESFEDLSKRNLEDLDYQLEYSRTEFRRQIETNEEIKDLETAWVRADNTTLYVRENARVVRDDRGKVLYYEGTVEDVTGRRLAEEKLREASSYNRRLIEASIDPLVTIGPDGKITDVNQATETVTGVARAQLIGDDFTNYFTEPLNAREVYQKVLSDGLVRDYPLTIRQASGKTSDVLYNATVYKNEAGKIQGVFAAARDITERKQAEAALVKTERIYRQAITEGGGVPYQVDYDNDRYIFLGEGFESLTGYLPSEMAGSESFASHIRLAVSYGENKELPHEQRVQLSRQEGSLQEWREDYLFERKDGTLVWISDHSVPVLDAAGNLMGSLGILMDITERKQAEESLRESEERYRALFLTSLEGIGLSKGNQILDANQALLDIFGYQEKQEFLETPLLELVAPESREKIEIYQQRKARGEPVEPRIEYRIVRKNREIRELEISMTSVKIKNELFTLGTFRDITKHKQAEAALRESEERFRFIFENANDAIFIENARDEFLSANQRACEILGYSLEEFQRMHVADIQAPEVRQPGSVVKNQMLQHKGSVFEGLDLHRSGRRIPVEISMGQIEQASGDLYVSIVRDITERKQAETSLAHQAGELRQRNQELARLYRASGSLLSGASSNLQELAQTIIGIIQQEFGQANCSLFLIQRDSSELQRLAAAGPYTDQVKNKTLTLDGPGLVPQAIRSGQTVNVGNVQTVPGYVPNWESAMSEMAVPLKIGNDVIGIIDTQSALPDAFDKQDEDLMTIFAERAALALEHSRMYEQTEARVQQLAALRTVDMAISSSFDIHLTLDILLDQVRAQLGVHAADILDYNQVTQTFSFSCGQGFRTHALQHTHLRLGEGYAGKAAMERRLLKVPDLHAEPSGFGRSPLLVGENFLSYAGVPLIAKGQIKGVLEIFNREPLDLSSEQQSFLEILAGQAGIAMDNAELYEHQQRSIADLTIAYNDTLEGWASALELRDKETEGHTRRVTNLTIRLARALGVNENDQVQIYRGALLHDIGKIGVPDGIVLKPGPLTAEEWEIMRQHPLYAYNMLSPIGYLREAINVPYCHHEKWDGTGYPRGLKAEEIPLAARIFSVVDVWDALTSDRPYRKAWTHEKARLYITEQSGTQFEPRVVDTFFREVLTQ